MKNKNYVLALLMMASALPAFAMDRNNAERVVDAGIAISTISAAGMAGLTGAEYHKQ